MSGASTSLFADEDLVGDVLGVVYRDGRTGFGVAEIRDGSGDVVRCSGPLSELVEGQQVRLVGQVRDHPTYGPTFEAAYYEQVTPATVAGLRTFLASERFDDVGGAVTDAVLARFGAGAGEVIERTPERLVAEAGLDEDEVARLTEAWRAGQSLAELIRLLQSTGAPYAAARDLHARYGAGAPDLLRDDPYLLLEARTARFAHADALAGTLGLERSDPRRLVAGARAAVRAARRRDGHEHLRRVQVVEQSSRLLGVDAVAAADGLARAIDAGTLAVDRPDGEQEVVSTPAALAVEERLAEHLARLLAAAPTRVSAHRGRWTASVELTAGQAGAVDAVFASPVTVLTGGPGTGKTRTVEEVVAAAESFDLQVALCAPTGRAARRLEEVVGRPATTVHRLLEARPAADGGFEFVYGAGKRLPYDLVVCDETSMCDTRLTEALVAAVDDGAHVLFVGDPDQLPSVGPGDVLGDLVRAEQTPTVRLTEIHRQAAGSRIVTLAREINDGHVGDLPPIDGDVFLAEEPRRAVIAPRVVEAVSHRAPAYFDVAVEDIQVIAPMYRGPAGVDALNAALKAALNPGSGRPDLHGLQVGDRVLQTRNDPDLEVSNGDIGQVVDLDVRSRMLRVAFPRGEVTYDRDRARDLAPAWAVTVHKAQGGEWPVVVLVCDRSHRTMLWRNLVYTAVTRATTALIVVGQAEALRAAAAFDRPRRRQTALVARLANAIGRRRPDQ